VGNLSPPVLTEITFRPTKKQAYQFLRVAFSFLRYSFETVGNLSPPVLAESERSDAFSLVLLRGEVSESVPPVQSYNAESLVALN